MKTSRTRLIAVVLCVAAAGRVGGALAGTPQSAAASADPATIADSAALAAADAVSPADPPPAPKVPRWAASGQLGLVIARGNTDTQTENAKIEVVHTTAAVKDDLEAEELYGKTQGYVTAERWATTDERDWNLTSRAFTFVNLHYEKDLFSGFAYQGNLGGGAGYKIIDSPATQLSAQAGAAFAQLRPEPFVENALGEVTSRTEEASENEATGTAKLHFQQTFNAQTKLTDDLSTVAGHLNIYTENDLALQVKLGRVLSLSVGYTIRNNGNPPGGLRHTDTLTTINLVYSTK